MRFFFLLKLKNTKLKNININHFINPILKIFFIFLTFKITFHKTILILTECFAGVRLNNISNILIFLFRVSFAFPQTLFDLIEEFYRFFIF